MYDNQGNTLEEQHKQSGDSTLSKTTYQYDSLNRNIKTVTRDGDVQENTYDPLGLRNEVKLNGNVSKYVFRGTKVSHELSEYDEVRNREVRG